MPGLILLSIVLILAAFFGGLRLGRRRSESQTHTSAQLREAWQQGYEAAAAFFTASGPKADTSNGINAQVRSSAQTQAGVTPVAAAPEPVQPYFTSGPFAPAAPAQPQQQVQAQVTPAKAVRVLTQRERELRNINITLYVAALMIVGAAALFLSFALTPNAKLISLCLLAAVFYIAGLLTHASKSSLRPAGAAFAGTGLALLPLCAIATYNTVALPGAVVWFIFSAIATLAVGFATIRLNSRILSWMAVLILVSTSMAGAAMMQRGMLYYMLFLLAISVVLLLLATMSARVRHSQFYAAVSGTAQILPALVGLLALVLLPELSSRDYLWIFFLLTGQLLLSVRFLPEFRLYRLYGARLSFMLMLWAASTYIEFSTSSTVLTMAIGFAAQAVVVLLCKGSYQAKFAVTSKALQIERAVLWGIALVSVALGYLLDMFGEAAPLISYVGIPLLILLTVLGLYRYARVEVLVVLGLPIIALMDTQAHFWRPLPSLVLGLAALFLIRRVAHKQWHILRSYTRWVLLMITGFVIGGSLWESTDGTAGANFALGVGAGVFVFAWGYWVSTLRLSSADSKVAGGSAPRLIRIAGSAVLIATTLAVWRGSAGIGTLLPQFLNVSSLYWFIGATLLSAVTTIVASWRLTSLTGGLARWDAHVRWGSVAMLAVTYALSFTRPNWLVAILVGVLALTYFVASRAVVQDQRWKMIYAALAQVVFSTMVWWFIDALHVDIHGHFALILLSVVLPQLTRLVLHGRSGQGMGKELQIITLALLILEPLSVLVYFVVVFGPDRGVLLLSAMFWGLHAVASVWAQRKTSGATYLYLLPAVPAVMLLLSIPALGLREDTGWIRSTWWSPSVACSLLLLMALVAVVLEWRLRRNTDLHVVIGAGIVLPLLLVAVWQAGTWQAVIAWAVGAVALALCVHTRNNPWFAAAASAVIAYVVIRAVMLLRHGSGAWSLEALEVVWALLGTAVIFYLMATLHGRWRQPVPNYPAVKDRQTDSNNVSGEASRLYFGAALLAGVVAGLTAHVQDDVVLAVVGGAVLIVAAAWVFGYFELSPRVNSYLPDGIFLLTALLGLSSYAQIQSTPKISSAAMYFCLVAVVLVAWRYLRKDQRLARGYLIAAAVAGSLSLVGSLADANSTVQLMALIFFVALVAWSLKHSDRLLIWWGAVAVTASILWFLRGLAFLWLVLLGLGLIAAAIYKLAKVDKGADKDPANPVQRTAPTEQRLQGPPRLPWQQPEQMRPPTQQAMPPGSEPWQQPGPLPPSPPGEPGQ